VYGKLCFGWVASLAAAIDAKRDKISASCARKSASPRRRAAEIRAAIPGCAIQAARAQSMLNDNIERGIEYIDPDEFVEATPKSLRLRKRILDATARNERHQTQPSCY